MSATTAPPATRAPVSPWARAWEVTRHLVGTSRPLSWINTAYPFAVAYLLGGGPVGWAFAVGVAYFLIPYNLLMYGVNDVFDYESDLRNPRKGGVEGIVLPRRWHRATLWAAAATNLPAVGYLAAVSPPGALAVLAVSVFAVVAYSAPGLRFKERSLLDSLTSATHFVSPAVYGLTLTGVALDATAAACLAGFFLWAMASHAFGAVQDITADRAAGLASVATWLDVTRTVRLALTLYAGAAVVLATTGWPAALTALLVVPYLLSAAPYRHLDDDHCEQAHPGWRRFLWLNLATGFVLTQGLLVTALLR